MSFGTLTLSLPCPFSPRQTARCGDALPADAEGEGVEQKDHVSDQWSEETHAQHQPHQLQHPSLRGQDGYGGVLSQGERALCWRALQTSIISIES